MQIKIIAMSDQMPTWIKQGFEEYSKRLPNQCSLNLTEIPLQKRNKNSDLIRIQKKESDIMLNKIDKKDFVIALDVLGQQWSTEQLSSNLDYWLHSGNNIALLIGGPEGLSQDLLARSNIKWSLGKLTYPHMLVRIIIAEQFYRAWSLLQGHPYHK